MSTQDTARNIHINFEPELPTPQSMGILPVTCPALSSTILTTKFFHHSNTHLKLSSPTRARLNATGTTTAGVAPESAAAEEPPSIDFAFVASRLLPDGTPDISIRSACGGQKLRDIMLDHHVDLYGPYAAPLSNCAGGGTCGTCLVEVVEGKELLSPRTDIEKEQLKKKPKTWRLACQATVGEPDSRGQVVIQQLPEWKAHEWE